ncbi:MAG: hypothetical protein MRY63_05690 [Neomegalonema sp.]|nr:hypothetical protein [Neomegalonema sp.]
MPELDFLTKTLGSALSPYHLTDHLVEALAEGGFEQVSLGANPKLVAGGRYILRKGAKTFCAWVQGSSKTAPVHLLSAHSDFPALRLRPNSFEIYNGLCAFQAELYGGPLTGTWFDRDLRVAGLVVSFQDGRLQQQRVAPEKLRARVSSTAPHLFKTADEAHRAAEGVLHCVFDLARQDPEAHFLSLIAAELDIAPEAIVEMDLWLSHDQAPQRFGQDGALLSSHALDNASSDAMMVEALLRCEAPAATAMIGVFDVEEVGSSAWSGAAANFLPEMLRQIAPSCGYKDFTRFTGDSLHISIDVAHAVGKQDGPAFADGNAPKLAQGPVIKLGAPGRYCYSPHIVGLLKHLAREHDIPLQHFMYPNGWRRGGSLAPYLATGTGIRTQDFGIAIHAMHSIREMGAVRDYALGVDLMAAFLNAAPQSDLGAVE